MSVSSSDDSAHDEEAPDPPSAPQKPKRRAVETESDGEGDEGCYTGHDAPDPKRQRQLREWQVLKEFSRLNSDFDSDETNEEIFNIARDEITPTINPNALRIIKVNVHKDLGIWKLKTCRHYKTDNTQVTEYHCPMIHRCNCRVALRVARNARAVVLSISGKHTLQTHEESKNKHLTLAQKGEIAKIVRAQAGSNSGQVRRQMQEASPQKKIPLSKRRSVQRMVTTQQRVILEQEGEKLKLDPTFGSLHSKTQSYTPNSITCYCAAKLVHGLHSVTFCTKNWCNG